MWGSASRLRPNPRPLRCQRRAALARYRALAALLFMGAIAACADSEPTGPEEPGTLTVMTRNIYIGTGFDPLLEVESLNEVPAAVAQVWANVQVTDFPERAAALADEIAATRPHLIGLQEATLFRRQAPGDFLLGNPVSATEVVLDYLAILLDELDARSLDYRAVAITSEIDLEAPLFTPQGLHDIRITDREVILARSDVTVSDIQEENYTARLVVSPNGDEELSVTIPKGWAAVTASVNGRTVRFASTHLEVAGFDGGVTQVAQGGELIQALETVSLPVVLVGDFNSAADGSTTPTYRNLVAAGYTDAWTADEERGPGRTCCQPNHLRNVNPDLSSRVDLVLFRGEIDVLDVFRVGAETEDRTPSGLWPSDHAGVVARLRLP